MKNTFFCLLALLAFNTLSAQSAIEQEALKTWNEVWQAYDRNDLAKAYSFYSAKACEIYPDGSLICGLDNIKAGYEQFVGMLEGTPSWKMDAPATRIISSDVVLMTSNVVSDIKLKGGQQVGGKTTFALILHKVSGKWLIEFSSQTPVLQMNEGGK